MPVGSAPPLMTAEELEHLYLPGKSTELVRGQLVIREPPSTWHGALSATIAYLVSAHVREYKLGIVFGQDTGFRIESDPDTVRAPDVAFVSAARAHLITPRGYSSLAPDLVVEIASPDDRPGEILAKVGDWLEAGTALVWVIDPRRQEARVHRPDGSISIVAGDGALDGEHVLPGFTLPLREALA